MELTRKDFVFKKFIAGPGLGEMNCITATPFAWGDFKLKAVAWKDYFFRYSMLFESVWIKFDNNIL